MQYHILEPDGKVNEPKTTIGFQARLYLVILLMLFPCYPQRILGQNSSSLASEDTIEFVRYPRRLKMIMALCIDREHIWFITRDHLLYQWFGNHFEDVSLLNEEYDHIFAANPSDVWLHLYQKDRYRYVFKRYNNSQVELYPDPDNFYLISIWSNDWDDIWAGGIVGTLLHFNGHQWHRHSGFTNNHIAHVCIKGDRDGWVVVERGDGALELHSVSLNQNRFQYQRKISRNIAFVSDGIWEVHGDSLSFSSRRHEHRSYLFATRNEPAHVIPVQKNVIFYYNGFIWTGRTENQPPFLLLIRSENAVLKLTEAGQVEKVAAFVTNEKLFTQFIPNDLNREKEYAAGFGFLDKDSYLDLYTILPEYENSLLVQKISTKAGGKTESNFQDHTFQFNTAENQLTRQGETYYDNGILITDLDNDGDQDLFITAHQGSNLYFENQNHRSFLDRTAFAELYDEGHRWNMAIAGDVDNDGDLDLFVTREYISNVLYLNNGFGKFEEVTEKASLLSERGGMGCAFADIDSDGDLDLFIANWRAKNRLYRNEGTSKETPIPTFTDITDSAGVASDDLKRTNSAIFGDMDNDGDLDLFVVNRVVPNKLYLNDGRGKFQDVTLHSGLYKENLFCEGAVFFDADHDGDLDLAVSCKEQNRFYRNHGNGRFQEERQTCGFVQQGNTGSIICGDFDHDGDIDLYATSYDKRSLIYENKQNDQRFIKMHLTGYRSNRDAVGARVYFYEGGHCDDPDYLLGLRTVEAGSGRASTNSKVLHFGTGDHRTVDCKVLFPSGIIVRKINVLPGSSLFIEELSGRQKYWALIKPQLIYLPRTPDFQMETLAYCGFLIFMLFIFPRVKREKWTTVSRHYVLPIMAIIIFRIVLGNQSLLFRLGVPLTFGLLTFILVVQFQYQKFQTEQQDELTDHLWSELNRFQHGDWARRNLNQLLFFAQNMAVENQREKNLQDTLLQNLNSYIQLTYPSLLAIARIGQRNRRCKNAAENIGRAAASIYRHLEVVKNKLQIGETVPLKRFEQIVDQLLTLRASLDLLTKEVEKKYECPIRDHLVTVRRSFAGFRPLDMRWDMNSIPEVNVRVRPSDLTPVLHNVIQNAQAAAREHPSPKLTMYGEERNSRLYLHFIDNGKGIPKNRHDKIFEVGFTTSNKEGKGLGLALSKQTLKKYGGDIYVARSSPGRGTEFVVELVIIPAS